MVVLPAHPLLTQGAPMGSRDDNVRLMPQDAVRDHLEPLLNYNYCGTLHGLEHVYDLREGG